MTRLDSNQGKLSAFCNLLYENMVQFEPAILEKKIKTCQHNKQDNKSTSGKASFYIQLAAFLLKPKL